MVPNVMNLFNVYRMLPQIKAQKLWKERLRFAFSSIYFTTINSEVNADKYAIKC